MKSRSLSLVIPVYNESRRLGKTFAALKKNPSFAPYKLKEIIFVSDGSTDDTNLKIEHAKRLLTSRTKAKVRLLSYRKNHGKGYALKKGILASTGSVVLFADCDVATPYSQFKKFAPHLVNGAQIVIGTRKNGHSTVVVAQPFYRQILGKGFTKLAQTILQVSVTDFTCGFKAFTRETAIEIFARSKIKRWGYDAEIMFLAQKLHIPFVEQAVVWQDDHRTRVNLVVDMVRSFKELIQIRCYDILNLYPNTLKVRFA